MKIVPIEVKNKRQILVTCHSQQERGYVERQIVKALIEYRQGKCKCTWKDLIKFGWPPQAIKGHAENCPLFKK